MSQSKKRHWSIEELSFCAVLFLLAPGLAAFEFADCVRRGMTLIQSLFLAALYAVGGLFVAGSHLYAAEKVRARFLIPVIGLVSAFIGVSFLYFGVASLWTGKAP